MYTIQKEKTALTLQDRIPEVADLEQPSEAEVRHHYSDGSELIPADEQAKVRRNGGQLPTVPQVAGYTVDDEGLVNAYTIEPAIYFAGHPSPEAQRRYLVQGAIAVLLVTLTVLIAFSAS